MTYRNRKLLSVVHELECVNCGAHGVQAAHANLQEFGKGMGHKASDAAIMALCTTCHTDLDQGKTMTKDQRRAMQFECITRTYVQLMERGLIEVAK
jgi:hypothetical protein